MASAFRNHMAQTANAMIVATIIKKKITEFHLLILKQKS